MPSDKLQLPGEFNYVIPDMLLRELCSTSQNRMQGDLDRFSKFITMNRKTIFIAKYWQDISREEDPGYPTDPVGTIEWNLTRSTRAIKPSDPPYLSSQYANSSPDIKKHLRTQDEFVRWMTEITESIKASSEYSPEIISDVANNCSSRHKYIRDPRCIAIWTQKRSGLRYSSEEWQKELCVFPDAHAFGKWTRLIAWYSLMHLIDRTKDFKNNYEDAHYAFIASYFDGIITLDRGQSDAVEAVFPSTMIFKCVTDIPPPSKNKPNTTTTNTKSQYADIAS